MQKHWKQTLVVLAILALTVAMIQFGGRYVRRQMLDNLMRPRNELIELVADASFRDRLLAVCDSYFSSDSAPGTWIRLPLDLADRIDGWSQFYVPTGDRSRDNLVLWCGGADNHFGLVITRNENEKPPHGAAFTVRRQLAARVWLFDELSLEWESTK